MTSKIRLFTAIFCFSLAAAAAAAVSVPGQTRKITSEEFYEPLRASNELQKDVSRRITTRSEFYKEGKVFSTTETTAEYLKPDKMRYVEVEKSPGGTVKNELIRIGEVYFCRKNGGVWKKSNSWCSGAGISGIPDVISSEYTVEGAVLEGRSVKLYRQYLTYKNNYSPNKDKEGLSYYQSRYWVDDEGRITGKESKSGLLEPERIYERGKIVYDYDPQNIKIAAPIK